MNMDIWMEITNTYQSHYSEMDISKGNPWNFSSFQGEVFEKSTRNQVVLPKATGTKLAVEVVQKARKTNKHGHLIHIWWGIYIYIYVYIYMYIYIYWLRDIYVYWVYGSCGHLHMVLPMDNPMHLFGKWSLGAGQITGYSLFNEVLDASQNICNRCCWSARKSDSKHGKPAFNPRTSWTSSKNTQENTKKIPWKILERTLW